jgi:pyruvate,water dikinase
MAAWWRKKARPEAAGPAAPRIRLKYHSFRELLSLNNECLELMAGLQEDLQFVPPRRDVIEDRVTAIYEKAEGIIETIEKLTGMSSGPLREAVAEQRNEVERYIAACQELVAPRLAARLAELGAEAGAEAGGKAAVLGETKNKLGLPVPDGYVLTTEAYRQFCGIPLWREIRDAIHGLDLNDLDSLAAASKKLDAMVMAQQVPRAVEIAITERAKTLDTRGLGLVVRSSAVGEGGAKTFAGQFLSLLNVPQDELVTAYKRVVAGRFSERALSYRLSTGLPEVASSMAVLFLPLIRARASGIMYTRDPSDAKSKTLWITATRGLGLDIASGRMPADLFVVSRSRPHAVLESAIAHKEHSIVPVAGGGIARPELEQADTDTPSLAPEQLATLAAWGVRTEEHFRAPQDIEWVVDEEGQPWIVQSRPLVLAAASPGKSRVRGEPLISGGRTIYPGRASGPAYLIDDLSALSRTPPGAVVFLRRASPEIVSVLPRIVGLVAEWGNLAGHVAALLREFKVPSVFQMSGAFDKLRTGDPVSLDAVQPRVYAGTLWPPRAAEEMVIDGRAERAGDPISRRLLTLNLIDPSASSFRPAGCKSTHDVLRYCHEKAIEAMFEVNDFERERGPHATRRLETSLPMHVYVLDLGSGLAPDAPPGPAITADQIVSRPFQALWKGVSHPAVTWTRQMPASLSDLASVMAGSLTGQTGAMRALGEESYLLVADEYMNLNSRLAYHFSLVDACLSDLPSNNYIAFRFQGGGATRARRNLRACFIEACLAHYGFRADRRGDLVNAWLKKASAEETAEKLDILGRLMASSSQLDMYMTSHEVMQWYVQQFLRGNYSFAMIEEEPTGSSSRPQ